MLRRPFLLVSLLLLAASVLAAETVHHDLRVTVEPEKHRISVRDTVRLAAGDERRVLHFLLHAGLSPTAAGPGVRLERVERDPQAGDFAAGTEAGDLPGGPPLELFRAELPEGAREFTLEYGGEIYYPLKDVGEEYARNFGVTPGLVGPEGVFLSGGTLWVPWLGPGTLTFSLEARGAQGWELVSQGARTAHERGEGAAFSRWESREPQDEVYLVGGPLTEYSLDAGPVQAFAFLREPDPDLARRYLEATARYLEMYSKLLGPYPYPKFALVENFWETGFGMPSFTLLGSQIIRFPFILTSSYPHEILHNWWGNSVFVEYATGNWAEGLTAYLSDHLFQEQRGEGAEYRQATLQKYADYAARAKDFPLAEFSSRRSAATEAVGYGKALMLFHVLRRDLGDEAFVAGLRGFYAANKFRPAGYGDLRAALEKAGGRSLEAEFRQWVERTGAPRLRVVEAKARAGGDGYLLTAALEQAQGGEPYRLRVPLAVTLEGRPEAFQTTVSLDAARQPIELVLPARPLRLDVDPEFDLFRLLDREETPPALSGSFGAERGLIVLPAKAPADLLAAYRALAEDWSGAKPGAVEVMLDTDVAGLPADRAVWVFGWENRLRPKVARALSAYDVEVGDDGVRIGKAQVGRRGHSVVLSARHPENRDLALSWLATDTPAALPGLGRKLPHYHKWSYLGFEGGEPANMLKGRWPVVGSPLTVFLSEGERPERAKLKARRALAELPPLFSKAAMLDTVRFLAGEELQGRGFGSPGLAKAADFIAERLREAGLRPGGDDGTWFQRWREVGGEPAAEAELRNVVAVLPGSRSEWAGQSVVVGAHYDGQGRGLAGGRTEDRGRIHPGADDNGSGVAVLLELARALKDWRPERSVVFAAFAGEEAGRVGSRRYVAESRDYPASKAVGMLNLDTVGRFDKKLLALGTGSAREWVHLFNGVSYTTGVTVESVAADAGGSDQVSFLDAGVPAVQLFTGPHLDYHRPTDTADKVNADGLVKVAAVAREAMEYLAARPGSLTRAEGGSGALGLAGGEGRKVSIGTVPDFAWQGEGYRLSGVAPGSPAEAAGLKAGDVITGLGGAPVKALRDFSEALKTRAAGARVEVTYVRDGQEHSVEVRVEAR